MQATKRSGDATNNRVVRQRRMGLTARLFGCHHKRLSLPRSNGSESYRECVNCGARRNFNPETWQTIGPFYFLERES
jgi:hypothetical protein